jgi:hypothetical protein
MVFLPDDAGGGELHRGEWPAGVCLNARQRGEVVAADGDERPERTGAGSAPSLLTIPPVQGADRRD